MSGKQPTPITPIAWSIDVSLLGQPSMLGAFAKVILLSSSLMGGLLIFLSLVLGNRDMVGPLLGLTAISAGVISVLLLFVVLAFFRNRMSMSYAVDARGARSAVDDRRARFGARAAIVAGVLGGKPGVAGAGLLAETSASQEIAWRAVRSVACSPRWRTVKLANAWRTVMVLYCLPENYEAVAAGATRAVAAQPAGRAGNPVAGFLLRSALMILGALPLFFLPRQISVEAFVPFLALCFALAAVWLLPVFGWVAIGAVAIVAGQAIFQGAQRGRLSFNGDDWALTALALVGAALFVWLNLALVRGRYAAALAGDLAEMSFDDPQAGRTNAKSGGV